MGRGSKLLRIGREDRQETSPPPARRQRGGRRRIAAPQDIITLYAERGWRRYDEAVSEEAHARQCAALAVAAGADDELVAAALLHDIGHLLDSPGDRGAGLPASPDTVEFHHGARGAALLRWRLRGRVAWLVEHHVIAKRYLCAVEPAYAARLSRASRRSLAAQGGPLPVAACRGLEAHPWFADAVRLRRWDDLAKDPAADVPPFDAYAPLLERQLRRGTVLPTDPPATGLHRETDPCHA
jgi:gamma-butyrobetaine dioxygenase